MNILICYMPKTELRVQSYDAMNNAKKLWFRAKKVNRGKIRIQIWQGAVYKVGRDAL